MQEKTLRLELLQFLDDIETAIVKKQYELAREDIQEYRQYLQDTTIVAGIKKSSDNLDDDTRL